MPQIEVKIDKDNKKLHIIDQGLGMTAEEVQFVDCHIQPWLRQYWSGALILGWRQLHY